MVANKAVRLHARAPINPGARISRVVPFLTETNFTLLRPDSRTATATSVPSGDHATPVGRPCKLSNSCGLPPPERDNTINRDIVSGTQRTKASDLPSGEK